MDMYRYVAEGPTQAVRKIEGGSHDKVGAWCAKIVVQKSDELSTLLPEQLNYISTIIVNFGSEQQPQWGCLQKKGADWICYLPHHHDLQDVKVGNKSAHIVAVDYVENLYQHESETWQTWHYILLGRVVPFCLDGHARDIGTYRHQVDVQLLREYSLQSVVISQQEREKLHAALTQSRPYTYQRAQALVNQAYVNEDIISKEIDQGSALQLYDNKDIFRYDANAGQLIVTLPIGAPYQNHAKILASALYRNKVTNIHIATNSRAVALKPQEADLLSELSSCDSGLLDFSFSGEEGQAIDQHYKAWLVTAWESVARNRFLKSTRNYSVPYDLWSSAAFSMERFFENENISNDFIEAYLGYKEDWLQGHCSSTFRDASQPGLPMWQFMQFAQMGVSGLRHFFDYVAGRQLGPDSIGYNACFDLDGSRFDHFSPAGKSLAQTLLISMRDHYQFHADTPLFQSLSLILPDSQKALRFQHSSKVVAEILALLNQQMARSQEAQELRLYNFDIQAAASICLLEELEKLIDQEKITVQIIIPDLDRQDFFDRNDSFIKGRYKALQNKILRHRREIEQKALAVNTRALRNLQIPANDHGVVMRRAEAVVEKTWPLAANISVGIEQQQQQQQQLEQAQQHQQQIVQEQQEEIEQDIQDYAGDEGLLVTRDNIGDLCARDWDQVKDDIKGLSGIASLDSLRELFNLWAGSRVNAAHVIQKIEPAAVRKLMHYAPCFRFGVVLEDLPAGFSVTKSRVDDRLILCYSQAQERLDIQKRRGLPKEKRNPYTIKLKQAMSPVEPWQGDYRQFNGFFNDQDAAPLVFWRDLGTVSPFNDGAANVFDEIKNDDDPIQLSADETENAALHLQHYCATGAVFNTEQGLPEIYDLLKTFAKIWTKGGVPVFNENYLNTILSVDCLPSHVLRAMGQLFYQYGNSSKQGSGYNGLYNFFRMGQYIYQAFGEENFYIWVTRFVWPTPNPVELLQAKQVNAVVECINTLTGGENARYAQTFWRLIDKHGKNTSYNQFAQLWKAFHAFIKFLNEKDLNLDHVDLDKLLQDHEDFTFLAFLERLTTVLKKFDTNLDAHLSQQYLLDHLSDIDWHHDGLFYAVKYDGYQHWHPNAEIQEFRHIETEVDGVGSYVPRELRMNAGISAWDKMAIRFVSRMPNITQDQVDQYYDYFKLIADNVHQEGAVLLRYNFLQYSVAKLCIVCTAIRNNNPNHPDLRDALNIARDFSTDEAKVLNWLAGRFSIEQDLPKETLQLHFHHIFDFAEVVCRVDGLQGRVFNLNREEALEFINASSGLLNFFSSHYFRGEFYNQGEAKENLLKFYQFIIDYNITLDNPLLMQLGWLFYPYQGVDFDVYEDLQTTFQQAHNRYTDVTQRLLKQLNSVDFLNSTALPNVGDIIGIFAQIAMASNDNQANDLRRHFIRTQRGLGCAIQIQDAAFRPLTNAEIDDFIIRINPLFLSCHQRENLRPCRVFLRECLAVSSDEEGVVIVQHLAQLQEALLKIDTKAYFNDLGQVLGTLREHATGEKRYSLAQLNTLLNALLCDDLDGNTLYPSVILDEILQHEKNAHSSLINADLDALQNHTDDDEKLQIARQVNQSKFPVNIQSQLIRIALLTNVNYDYFYQCFEFISHLQDQGFSSSRIQMPLNVMLRLAEQSLNKTSDVERIQTIFTHAFDIILHWDNSVESAAYHPTLESVWQASQGRLCRLALTTQEPLYVLKEIASTIAGCSDFSSTKVKALFSIIVYACDQSLFNDVNKLDNNIERIKGLFHKLKRLSESDLVELACYFEQKPRPSLDFFEHVLKDREGGLNDNISDILYYFESSYEKDSKRNYSVSPSDADDLYRVLSGFKLKGERSLIASEQQQLINLFYYTNSDSQYKQLSVLSSVELTEKLLQLSQNLRNNPHATIFEKASLLAIMREILLRQTGKWANHTQMLVLLYAAIHDEESLLYQVKTGQGKSIISFMRAAYLALDGRVVDVLSAKESLSQRDQKEFSHVFAKMCIPCAYIEQNSPVEAYQQNLFHEGVGAVNYATIGGLTLFRAGCVWRGENIDLSPDNRVALLDEADHILLDEDTQFNFTADGKEVFNYETWVYQAVYDFYERYKDDFYKDEYGQANERPTISLQRHILPLIQEIERASFSSPVQSKFMVEFIRSEDREKCHHKLRDLLTATHAAAQLKEGVQFTVLPEQKQLYAGTTIRTSFAKVLIKNQIKHGSTYSELVQQFLHVRLNAEAARDGKTPNFFIEPETQIALSQNAKQVITAYYHKLEGCTGTAGDEEEVDQIKQEYHFDRVIKLPTHEVSKSELLPTIFAQGFNEQVNHICNVILGHADQPILIACRDDSEVVGIHEAVIATLRERKANDPSINIDPAKIIGDTNASGKTEKELLTDAGKPSAVTISARMGRGTDIKPTVTEGLFLVRTYPAQKRTVKQEIGRQGRNGRQGRHIDIIDFEAVCRDYNALVAIPDLHELILKYEQKYLAKYQRKLIDPNALTWQWLHNKLDNVVKLETVAAVQHHQRLEQAQFRHRKEFLLARLSERVIGSLQASGDAEKREQLQTNFVQLKKDIDLLWHNRLAGCAKDSEAVYQQFCQRVEALWYEFVAKNPDAVFEGFPGDDAENILLGYSLQPEHYSLAPEVVAVIENEPENLQALIESWQAWVSETQRVYFSLNAIHAPHFYITQDKELTHFYELIDQVRQNPNFKRQAKRLYRLLEKGAKGSSQYLTLCIPLVTLNALLEQIVCEQDDIKIELKLNHIQTLFEHPVFHRGKDFVEYMREFSCLVRMTTGLLQQVGEDARRNKHANKFLWRFLDGVNSRWEMINPLVLNNAAKFLEDEQVADNLLFGTNAVDIERFVEILAFKDPENVNVCIQYLKGHHDDLEEEPQLFMPIVTTYLESYQGNNHEQLAQNLEKLHKRLFPEGEESRLQQLDFWHFLEKRRFTDQDIEALAKCLKLRNKGKRTLTLHRELCDKIMQLPASASILAIIQDLSACQLNIRQMIDRLSMRQQVITLFENFCQKLDMPTGYFAQHIGFLLEHKEIDRVKIFFEALSRKEYFTNIPAPTLAMISKKWIYREIRTNVELLQNLKCAARLVDLYNAYLQERIDPCDLDALLVHHNIERVQIFFEILKINVFNQIPDAELVRIGEEWADQHIREEDELLQKLHNVANFREVFDLEAPIKIDSSNETAFINIKDRLQTADAHSEVDFDGYFVDLQEHQTERVALMQLVEHEAIISVPEGFYERCSEQYLDFSRKLIMPERARPNSRFSQEPMCKAFQNMAQLAYEFSQIARPEPEDASRLIHSSVSSLPTESQAGSSSETLQQAPHRQREAVQAGILANIQRYMGGSFFVNGVRKQQAHHLLVVVKHIKTNDDFYMNMLQAISGTQNAILNSDRGTQHNKKGFSRLYSITLSLFCQVAKECLADTTISRSKRAEVYHYILNNLKINLKILLDRLKIECPRSSLTSTLSRQGLFQQPNLDGGDLAMLVREINVLSKRQLPKHLHYLIDNIQLYGAALGITEINSHDDFDVATSSRGGDMRQNVI